MALPDFSMRQLLEAGAHFGHQTHRWNPKMAPYIFGARNNIHIIDLAQTVPLLHQRARRSSATPSPSGGRVLFVGTKRQAPDAIADAAKRSAQYFVNHRWLGGMLTNWKTISQLDQAPAQARRDARPATARASPRRSSCSSTRERDKLEQGARRHQGHGRPARPAVRDRHQQGGDRDQGGQAPRHPGRRRSSTPTAIRTASTSRSRATTTPAAPSRSIATSIARAAHRRHLARPGAAGRRHRRVRDADRRGAAGANATAAEQASSSSARRAARRAGRSDQAHRRRPAARAEAQRRRRLPLLADRRHDAERRGAARHGRSS